jgi:lipopolysaccharide/colanic/teichoic acid biosynthesis glycosyltransferase
MSCRYISVTKRVFDLACSGLGLIVLAPIMLVVAGLICLDSPGPIFFQQERIGLRGRSFKIFKFRTMRVDADKLGGQLTVGRDPRITRVGRFLRKSKLDELPQLFNVWQGEMSLVGPRPEVPKYVALYTWEQRRVLEVRPGITDLASIEFRDENDLLENQADPEAFYIREIMPRKLALNLGYITQQGLTFDLLVILKTIWRVLFPAQQKTMVKERQSL